MIARKLTLPSETIHEEDEEDLGDDKVFMERNANGRDGYQESKKRRSKSRVSFCSSCSQDDLFPSEEETSFCVPPMLSSSEPDSMLSTKSDGAMTVVQTRRRKMGVAGAAPGSET